MIRRETDADLINRVSNGEGVRSSVCYHDGPMDWSAAFPTLQTGVVIVSNGEDACAAFERTGERSWQAHTLFGPTCRGRKALDTAREMIEHMRPYSDVLWGATPMNNCAARWFNRQLGAMPIRREHFEAEGEVEIFEIRM